MSSGLISARHLYDIANAIRVKTGGSSLIAPENMAAEILTIDGSLSGTITPSEAQGAGLITDSILSDIADAIRTKLDVATRYTPGDMAAAILSIQGGGLPDFDVIAQSTEIMGRAQNLGNYATYTTRNSGYHSYVFYYESDTSQPSGWRIRGNQTSNTCSMLNVAIPAGYKKLYIDIEAAGATGAYNLSTMYLRTAYGVTGYYGGQFAGDNLKTVGFCSYGSTYDQLAAQSGVSGLATGSGMAYSVTRRIVTVDISDLSVDAYIGWHRCDNWTRIYSLVAKTN